jgi:hypothetical protein
MSKDYKYYTAIASRHCSSFNTLTTKQTLHRASWHILPLPTLFPPLLNIGSITVPNGTTPQEEMYCTCSKIIWLFLSILHLLDYLQYSQPHSMGRSSLMTQITARDPTIRDILVRKVAEFSLASAQAKIQIFRKATTQQIQCDGA